MGDGAAPMKRFALGTVQLGVPYGRGRNRALMPVSEAEAILDAAWEVGIRAFDTAEAYGEAAGRLAGWLAVRGHASRAHVVTKVQPTALDTAQRALQRFDGVHARVLLSHGVLDAPEWARLAAAAAEVGADAGQSVYSAAELCKAVELGARRIQAPANVFDSRAFDARAGGTVRLDLRSAYLQGVLLDAPADADRRVAGGARLADAVARAASDVGVPAPALLVAAVVVAAQPGDRVIVGLDAPDQAAAIVEAGDVAPDLAREFARRARQYAGVVSPSLLDPRTWPTAA